LKVLSFCVYVGCFSLCVFLFVSNVLKVRALLRFADETALEVTTAAKLRAGSQRDGSRPAPFHTALLVRELFV
jgi:hypothetical protein